MLRENTNRALAYEEALLKQLKRSDVLDGQSIAAVRRVFEVLQERLIARINREMRLGEASSSWGLFWVTTLSNALSEILEDLGPRLALVADTYLPKFYEVGQLLVDKPVSAATGLSIVTPKITVTKLAVLAPYRSSLVTDVSEYTRQVIQRAIVSGVALGESPDALIKEISGEITTKGTLFRKAVIKAERIVRTEMARVQSRIHEARTRDIITEFPQLTQGALQMRQKFVSVHRGPYPCKICAPFEGTVWEINDPKKPNPPDSTHPNCRCQMVNFFPGISSNRRTPEIPSSRQAAASLTECVCCH